MLYYLFGYLHEVHDLPGAGVFQYISFRAAMAIITSLVISMVIGKYIIQQLQLKQVGEIIRDLDLQGQAEKKGTPTMGGLIIIAAIIIPFREAGKHLHHSDAGKHSLARYDRIPR